MAGWTGSNFNTFEQSDPIMGAVTGGLGGLGGGSTPGSGEWDHVSRAAVASSAIKTVASVSGGVLNGFLPGAGSVLSIGLGSIGDTVSNSAQAYGAQKTVAQLKKIVETYPQLDRSPRPQEWQLLSDAIDYALVKKKSQWGRYTSKAIPGVNVLTGAGVAGYQMIRGAQKLWRGTKGKHRAEMAESLIKLSQSSDADVKGCAAMIIQALAGATFEGMLKKSVADAFKSSV